ncbi:hypothetical protein [Parafilimonas sp.]|uniref:hypothetical protein n=1 Tax=Parafilimonas sp. TaxID=1969739 RepID=UPI003F7E1243
MKQLIVIAGLIFFANAIHGQDKNIGQFAIWKPKEAMLQNFENGYKQHLNWHKANGDKWDWYGWFIISGARYGQFVDATFDHNWADFDKAVKPADDMADNRLHVFPFADVQTVFKVAYYAKASTNDTFMLKASLLKLVTLSVDDIDQSLKVCEMLKDHYASDQIKYFKVYKMIDGGDINQIIILMGFENWKDYAISENLNDKISAIQEIMKVNAINSISSETLVYRKDMSLFPG